MTKQATVHINFGLLASIRFPAFARKRVLTEVNTSTRMSIPYITTGIICDLEEIGGYVDKWFVATSETEPTLCMVVTFPVYDHMARSNLLNLASRYAQDCIAVSHGGGSGELIGKYATLWGAFSDDYFIEC